MKLTDLKPGVKLFDNTMTRVKREERVCVVRSVSPDTVVLRTVRTDKERTVRTIDILSGPNAAELVADVPDVYADIDMIVGTRVRLHLVDGGTASGVCTVVQYHEVKMDGEDQPLRQIKAIQLDRSSTTTYAWTDVRRLEAIAG